MIERKHERAKNYAPLLKKTAPHPRFFTFRRRLSLLWRPAVAPSIIHERRKRQVSEPHVETTSSRSVFCECAVSRLRVRTRDPESAHSQPRECALTALRVRAHFSPPPQVSVVGVADIRSAAWSRAIKKAWKCPFFHRPAIMKFVVASANITLHLHHPHIVFSTLLHFILLYHPQFMNYFVTLHHDIEGRHDTEL